MSKELFNLTGQLAIVTGASRGIGKAIAVALGEQQATVVGTATTQKGADAIKAYLANHNIAGAGICLNVNDRNSIEQFFIQLADQFRMPDILVNNAGITRDNLILRMKDSEWDEVIATNLSSVFQMSKACLKNMLKNRHGRIINITSISGLTGLPGQANYAAAKAGIIGFSKSMAREYANRGITVNCIAPGFIESDMTAKLSEEYRQQIVNEIPMQRMGQPKEIAAAVVYLASHEAAYITGTTLNISGGIYMA